MTANKLFIVLFVSILCAVAVSQETKMGGVLTPVPEKLRQLGVPSDEPSLVAALTSSKSEIRALAATQLAEIDAKNALPAVLLAMNEEKDSDTRVTIAFSVARLGAQAGISSLKTTCESTTEHADARLHAASSLQYLGQDYCHDVLKSIAGSASDPDSRAQALYDLASPNSLQNHSFGDVRGVIRKALRDKAASVRLAAASIIARIGDRSDAPSLEGAISAEKDDQVRSTLQGDLKRLLRE
jgi:HEAT repeat protein